MHFSKAKIGKMLSIFAFEQPALPRDTTTIPELASFCGTGSPSCQVLSFAAKSGTVQTFSSMRIVTELLCQFIRRDVIEPMPTRTVASIDRAAAFEFEKHIPPFPAPSADTPVLVSINSAMSEKGLLLALKLSSGAVSYYLIPFHYAVILIEALEGALFGFQESDPNFHATMRGTLQ